MLQIVTKRYFRDDVPLHSTVHRRVLWTNRSFLHSDSVGLPVGELAPSTGFAPVSAVTLSVTEHLEAKDWDGEDSVLVATSGTELIDDLADTLSFALNAVFSRDRDLVESLVPRSLEGEGRESASALFRHTFDPARHLPPEEIADLRRFMAQLLDLQRDGFEAVMRAIRRVARATQRASADPTLAYLDLVAALESLSEGAAVPAPDWERLDGRKRRLVDDALRGADDDLARRVRRAVVEAERLGSRGRFVAFVMGSVSPEFFGAEATGAMRPIRGADLERALRLAYDIRSARVHVLVDLPPEAWVLGDRGETVSPPGFGTMLSLEGLARLARHVIRNYVASAQTGVDATFNWRDSLPGVLQMQAAPQYWIWRPEGFDQCSAERYFSGFASRVIESFAGRAESLPDMGEVLERVEQLLPETAEGAGKDAMVAIYCLWHRVVAPSGHRPRATEILSRYGSGLQLPRLESFVVGLLTDEIPDWSVEQWRALATGRREERLRRRHRELPPSIDAALQVMAAERMSGEGDEDAARLTAGYALQELPGNEMLIAWEAGLHGTAVPELDLNALVLGLDPGADGQQKAEGSAEAEADERG